MRRGLAFGGAHVGPIPHDRFRIAHRRDIGKRGDASRLFQFGRDGGWGAAHQHTNPILRGGNLRFPRGNLGQRRAELGLCALGIEGTAAPGVEPLARDLERAALILRVLARDAELLLCATQLEIRQGQLGGE